MVRFNWFRIAVLGVFLALVGCSAAHSEPTTPTPPTSAPSGITGTAVPESITALPSATTSSQITGVSSVATAASTASSVQLSPQPIAPTAMLAALKYRIINQYPGSSKGILWCDPDFYPVARLGIEQANAATSLPTIQQDKDTFQAILSQLKLSGTTAFTPDQQLLIYREYKVLRFITLQATTGGYSFQISYQTASGNFQVSGIISSDGTISAQQPQPLPGKGINCPICLVASTLIDTPDGPIAVKDLQVGMSVWSVNKRGNRMAVSIVKTAHVAVPFGHIAVHLRLSDGRELWASPLHPTADKRPVGSLQVGDLLDGATVIGTERVSYPDDATYDILPAGDTGFYWANGILMGSTLADSTALN